MSKRVQRWARVSALLLVGLAGTYAHEPATASCIAPYCWEIHTMGPVNDHYWSICRPRFRSGFCECGEVGEVVIAWGTCYYDNAI